MAKTRKRARAGARSAGSRTGTGGAPPDFGRDGRIQTNTNIGAAIVNTSRGEHISCTVDVSSGIPEFVFSCRHRDIWAAPDFEGHPKARYQFFHFKLASDADGADDTYVLTMLFAGLAGAGPMSYRFVMDHLQASGAPIQRLKDIEYSSGHAGDFFHESIRLFVR